MKLVAMNLHLPYLMAGHGMERAVSALIRRTKPLTDGLLMAGLSMVESFPVMKVHER